MFFFLSGLSATRLVDKTSRFHRNIRQHCGELIYKPLTNILDY